MKELPNEVWLLVFAHFNYGQLKKCTRVNKTFQALTLNTAFDKVSFRCKDVIPADPGRSIKVELHPAFHAIQSGIVTSMDEVFVFDDEYDDEVIPITETCAAKEFATYPTVARIRLKIMDHKMLDVRNVMQTLCKWFKKHGVFELCGDRTGWNGWEDVSNDRQGNPRIEAAWFDS